MGMAQKEREKGRRSGREEVGGKNSGEMRRKEGQEMGRKKKE
jgi:hypothetical protein